MGIAAHIESGEKRVGIQQIANENYLSAATIVKMCKRLGFDGYSELYYYLSRQTDRRGERSAGYFFRCAHTARAVRRKGNA